MSNEARNVRNFKRFQEEMLGKGDMSALDECMGETMIAHGTAMDGLLALMGKPVRPAPITINRQTMAEMYAKAFAGTGGQSRKVLQCVAQGDLVFARWTLTMTVDGDYHGIPANGREITVEEWGVIRFDGDGKIIEGRFLCDTSTILNQLGASLNLPA